ncbi:MAG: tetratricopeptide repeat protein, partial [Bacteroidota bacterium]
MRFIYFVFLLSCCCTLNAQSYLTKKTATGKALKWYTSAKADAYHKEYEAATKTLNKLLTSFPDFIDAQLLLAQIQFDQQQYAEAAANFERTLAIDPNYNARIYYMLGVNEWKRDEFERSAQFLGQYIERKPRNVERLKRAKRMLANAEFAAKAIKNPVPYMPKPLASTINTTRPEYAAAFTADEQMLIFTRRILEQNGPRTYVHEDFYISQKDANGNWQTAQAWQSINTPQNEGGHSISADGKLLVFTACDYKSSVGGCDIYFVEQTASGQWTRPQSVGENINTRAAEALPTLSADGKTMIFASNRNGTFGQKDLWISYRQDDGKWKTPENLGDKVNTPFKEDAPFLHPDGKTLYFMSNGHPGMGGSDLYFSKLQADGTWDTPINLGYPINTKGDEGALSLSFDGEIAYFARDKQQAAEGNVRERDIDIFTFEMPTNARPEAITYVQANVRDASTKQLLSA